MKKLFILIAFIFMCFSAYTQIINEDFETTDGGFTSALGEWTWDNHSIGSNTTKYWAMKNGDYDELISPELDLSPYESVKITFDYVCFDDGSGMEHDIMLWVTEEGWGFLPWTQTGFSTTWTEFSAVFSAASYYNGFQFRFSHTGEATCAIDNLVLEVVNNPLPDLTCSSLSATPYILEPGMQFMSSVYIENIGSLEAPTNYTAYYLSNDQTISDDDIELGNGAIGEMPPNYGTSIADYLIIPEGTLEGTWYILFFADYQNLITESNEDNNVVAAQITVANEVPKPDYTIYNASWNTEDNIFAEGEQVSISFGTTNLTAIDVITDFGVSFVKFYVSTDEILDDTDILLGEQAQIPDLPAGFLYPIVQSLSLPESMADGEYYLITELDAENFVIEQNEDNNTEAIFFVIGATTTMQDLTIGTANIQPTQALAEATLSSNIVIETIKKLENCTSSLKYYFSEDENFDINDQLLTSYDFLLPSARGWFDISFEDFTLPNIEAGNYYIIAYLDQENLITEDDETNNMKIFPIEIVDEITQKTDYTVSSAQFHNQNDNTFNVNENFEIRQRITNIGNRDAYQLTEGSVVNYYLSDNNILDDNDIILNEPQSLFVPALPINGYYERTDQLTIPVVDGGNYFLITKADADNELDEINEDNNYFAIELIILNPTILVETINITGEGNISEITELGGNLQIISEILPANATNNSVTWSLSTGENYASIDQNGLLTAIEVGTVTVRATANDQSGTYGETDIEISNQVSINSTENQISIFPNPSNGTFTIANNELQIKNIQIIDITGKVIHNQQFVVPSSQFSIKENGIYFIKIQTEKQFYTHKIIIK